VCREITLPKWPAPASLLPRGLENWQHLILGAPVTADLDFRAVDGGMLVGLFGLPGLPKGGPAVYSPARYWIDLATGRVRKASEGDWMDADPYFILRDSTLQEDREMRPDGRLVYRDKEFSRKGVHWPLTSRHAARVSPDGAFLAVNGWDGDVNAGGDLADIFNGGHIEGNYYVEIYDVGSATLALSLTGRFKGIDPGDFFQLSAWISKRYYLLPLNTLNLNRFVLCDVQQAATRAK
jgi:hypothetical protein